jgi:hypothetical protein
MGGFPLLSYCMVHILSYFGLKIRLVDLRTSCNRFEYDIAKLFEPKDEQNQAVENEFISKKRSTTLKSFPKVLQPVNGGGLLQRLVVVL